eukprot:8952811-Pyramimonas_sp.AAC.1
MAMAQVLYRIPTLENIPARPVSDWSVVRIYPHALPCIRLVRHENVPARSASDWSVMRIYPRVLRPIGPS